MSDSSQKPAGLPFAIKPSLILLAVVVIFVIITALTSAFVVDQKERAVITRFGKYSRTLGPGLQFKMPLTIEKSYIVETEIFQSMQFGYRTEEAGIVSRFSSVDFPEESIMLTGDLNIVDFEWDIKYRIVDPVAWLFNVEDQMKTIRDVSISVINQLVGDRAILDVISSARERISADGLELMNKKYQEYGLGITVTQIQMQNTRPPEGQVLDAFEDVNIAIQDMNRLINEGKEEYNRVIPRARGEAEKIVQEASGYAAERTNLATGDVARFKAVLTEYLKAPEITETRLYLEMIEEVFAGAEGTNLIDKNLGSNFLPLLNVQGGQQ